MLPPRGLSYEKVYIRLVANQQEQEGLALLDVSAVTVPFCTSDIKLFVWFNKKPKIWCVTNGLFDTSDPVRHYRTTISVQICWKLWKVDWKTFRSGFSNSMRKTTDLGNNWNNFTTCFPRRTSNGPGKRSASWYKNNMTRYKSVQAVLICLIFSFDTDF